jgi:hypothetical protein
MCCTPARREDASQVRLRSRDSNPDFRDQNPAHAERWGVGQSLSGTFGVSEFASVSLSLLLGLLLEQADSTSSVVIWQRGQKRRLLIRTRPLPSHAKMA